MNENEIMNEIMIRYNYDEIMKKYSLAVHRKDKIILYNYISKEDYEQAKKSKFAKSFDSGSFFFEYILEKK